MRPPIIPSAQGEHSRVSGARGKPGIAGIDTRCLTIKTRWHETLRAALIVDGGNGDVNGGRAVELARGQPGISAIDPILQVTCTRPHHIKGFEHPDPDVLSVQHHPEAHPGIFDRVARKGGS